MREATRRGRITAAERRDYEAMRRREALPWPLRYAARLRIPAIVALTLAALAVGLLVFQALLTALMVAMIPLVSRGWVPLLIAAGVWFLWPRTRRRRRR